MLNSAKFSRYSAFISFSKNTGSVLSVSLQPSDDLVFGSHFLRRRADNFMLGVETNWSRVVSQFLLLMIIRPLIFWSLGILVFKFVFDRIVQLFMNSKIFTVFVPNVQIFGDWVLLGLIVGLLMQLTNRFLLYRKWLSGIETCCKYCGGPQSERYGRYGFYLKCYVCQRTEKSH